MVNFLNLKKKRKLFKISKFPAIPIKQAEKSSHVAIIVTARGGHIGFLEGWWPYSKDQYMGRLFSQFFSAALFDPHKEFDKASKHMIGEFLSPSDKKEI